MNGRPFQAALIWMSSLAGCGSPGPPGPKSLVQIGAENSGRKYLSEFLAAERRYPEYGRDSSPRAWPPSGARAPDGAAWLTLEEPKGTVSGRDSCRSVWLTTLDGRKRHLVTARDMDPGSGISLRWAWSSDSKAVFLYGEHSGIDCPERQQPGSLRIVYTVADGVAWGVSDPPFNEDANGP